MWKPKDDEGHFGNQFYRWTILYGLLIFLIATLPIWMAAILPSYIFYINTGFIIWFTFIWVVISFNAILNFSKLEKMPVPSLQSTHVHRIRKFNHAVVVPCYLDPIDVLFDCLGSLMLQAHPQHLFVIVTFEAKTPHLEIKKESIQNAFKDKFGHFLIVTHTVDRHTEIAGGCSNKNYALREMVKYMNHNVDQFIMKANTVTTCDTDSLFHPNYFSTLEHCYNESNPDLNREPRMCVWQSPLFYNWDLDKRPFFNRITGIMRSMMMLGGLISFNLNPMSIFSFPIELGLKSGFINPRYSVDDIIAKVRWMCCTDEAVPVLLLPCPSISGPTIGTTWWLEVVEWARQIRRWIVGSSESFHYFMIHFRGKPLFSGILWIVVFVNYYAMLLCSAGIFTTLAGLPLFWVPTAPIVNIGSVSFSLSLVPLISLIVQYIVFGVGFIIDHLAVRLMTVKEDISLQRNLVHWLLAPPTLLVYSLIAFHAILEFIFQGKKMARHDMAAKEGLVANTTKADISSPLMMIIENDESQESRVSVENDLDEGSGTWRTRSTSVSREINNRISNNRLASSTGDKRDNVKGKQDMLLTSPLFVPDIESSQLESGYCKLPERFYFGQYSQSTSNKLT